MLMRLMAVALGGALGAVSRYVVSGWVHALARDPAFPLGTVVVNATGSFLIGLLMASGDSDRWLMPPLLRLLLGAGFLGALTTFSTFSFETVDALKGGDLRVALANVTSSLVLALLACWLGLYLGERWWGG